MIHLPADAVRVELVSVISGHGGATPGNCAEFCNTTHHYFVNGTEMRIDNASTIAPPTTRTTMLP